MPTDAEIARDPAILTAQEAASAAADLSDLPPEGDARRDALHARADLLEEAAERMRDAAEIGAVDPKVLEVEREIGRYATKELDGSEVSGALPDYVYRWEQADIRNSFGGIWVTQSKALGWQIVDGDMPEAKERRYVDGTRRWGDTILMRMPRARYEALCIIDRRRRLARMEGISIKVLEEADRLGVSAYDINDAKAPSHIRERFGEAQRASAEAARATMVSKMRQAGRSSRVMASALADRKLDRAIREGAVPGMPATT